MINHRRRPVAAACLFTSFIAAMLFAGAASKSPDLGAQDPASQPATRKAASQPAAPPSPDYSAMIARGAAFLLSVQEGDDKAEWPYEGVYRVRGQIPIGYRVGGTGLCATALLRAPDYENDAARKQAVARATKFVIAGIEQPLMNPVYDGGYDVRGWGYTCGLAFLLELKARNAIPPDMDDDVEKAIHWYIDALCKTEINQVGGWNYARQQGRDAVSPPAPFMTGPTLQALFAAKSQGYAVDPSVVDRAIATLEQARTPTGSVRYSGVEGGRSNEPVPGAVGRMLVTETTLYLAGKSNLASVRSAIDAFIVHWEWLDKRRAQQGTHMPPYNIAPYYFYFAHYYAAQAVEMLPNRERAEYRRRINELLMSTRHDDGTWNDRVFERTANFGTAMSIMALMMPDTPAPPRWQPG